MSFPRLPFVGLAVMAALGIVAADFVALPESQWLLWAIGFGLIAVILLWRPHAMLAYAVVGFAFFAIHNFQTGDTVGLRLATALTDRPRVVTAIPECAVPETIDGPGWPPLTASVPD